MLTLNTEPAWKHSLNGSALRSLTTNNRRILTGSEEVVVTPFLEELDDAKAISEIESILSKVTLTDKLRAIESSNRDKIGPRSIAIPWSTRKASLEAYFKHEPINLGEDFHDEPRRMGLRPISLETSGTHIIKTSSSGLPELTRKGSLLPIDSERIDREYGEYPAMLYTRTAEGGKTRNVWGYPFADTVRELQFFAPWLPIEKALPYRAALKGAFYVDEDLTKIVRRPHTREDTKIVCVDFSAYDATVAPIRSMDAFRYISSYYQPRFRDALHDIAVRFITVPITTPDGDFMGIHGVPSGSTFTNTIDSLVQARITINSGLIDRHSYQVQGDDGVYVIDEDKLDRFYGTLKEAGLVLNEDKSYVSSEDAVYLQRYYHPMYSSADSRSQLGGVYSLFRAFNRIKYLDRFYNLTKADINASDYFALRTIMILENCKHHPGFVEFVKYIAGLDRDKLSYDQESLMAFSKMYESKVKANVMSPITTGGLESFHTLRVITGMK